MYPARLLQYEMAKNSWIMPFDYQEKHDGMKVRTSLTRALAACYGIETDLTQTICQCVERFNTASLVHDDIVDEDRVRRGAPSVWVKYGVATALISGMYGYIDGLQKMCDLQNTGLMKVALDSLESLHIGQYLDTQISEGTVLPTLDEYRFVAQTNTGCFFLFILEAFQNIQPLPEHCHRKLKEMLLELAVYYRFINDYCDINHIPHFKKKGFAPDLEGGPKSFLMILANQPLTKQKLSESQKKKIIIAWGSSGVFIRALKLMEDSYQRIEQCFYDAQLNINDRDFRQLEGFLQNVHFEQNIQDNFYESLIR
ncbi:polyprenyl synthetase family protein [Pseudomonas sp. NPDC087803]|uniref:polyprenyl synthetase family protein n=1 Tax=Pseudomonas sp. NPDC087803 TaxID=3364448 RepID=UPI00382C0DDE